MPTLAELKTEQVWHDQFVPAQLASLVVLLEHHYQPGVTNIGAYGDYRHLSGYHRSRNWILRSRFCTNRFYSVSDAPSNMTGGDGDWISAVDIVVGQAESERIFRRVNAAKARGQLGYVKQVLLERSPWHVHLSLARSHANVDHDYLFGVIIDDWALGEKMAEFSIQLPVLRHGSEGADVVTVQALLGARGFTTALDGDFGPDTEAKTVDMQRVFGAESIDGIWGPETWTIGITGEDRR